MNRHRPTWHTPGVSRANSPLRGIPQVDGLISEFEGRIPRPLLSAIVRQATDEARRSIGAGIEVDIRAMIEDRVIGAQQARGVRVINATGVLLHTNLGRAGWSQPAIEAASAAAGQIALELDLATGERGARGGYVTDLLIALTGCEDAMVVNNNAAGVLLALAATSFGKAVPVSRGELIEIGGSYRLPEVMAASGARLVEVGTTNRTRAEDYRTALQIHEVGAILKVHPSNFRIEGFTEEVGVETLAVLARSAGVTLIHDIGSGLLDRSVPWLSELPAWLEDEPGARQSLEAGADLVTFSGDKLLGGPQAGIILGASKTLALLRSHPLARALRVDGVTYGALTATLEAYARADVSEIPFWAQAMASSEGVAERASAIAKALGGVVKPGFSTLGAGSAPGATIPTSLVWLGGEDHLFEPLLALGTPVLARRQDGGLVIDPRTVAPSDDPDLIAAIARCR
jgi:L-seryl-tRNA(Ser) seleniumtransferase